VLAGSQTGRRVEGDWGGEGGQQTWGKLALWGQTVTIKTGQMGREIHIFWMQIYVWWVVPTSNCTTKQRENLTLHSRWSRNRTTQCLLKPNSSHYFRCKHKRIIWSTVQLTWNSCDDKISIIKGLYYSLKTTKCLNQFNIHPHDQIIIRAPENKNQGSHDMCFLHSNLWIHAAALFLPHWCKSQEMANVQFRPSQDTENRHLNINIYQNMNHFPRFS